MPRRRYRRKLSWMEYVFPAVVLLGIALCMYTCNPADASAEWIEIRNFGGVFYDANAGRIPWTGERAYASRCEDWLFLNGEMERPSWGWKDSRPTVAGTGINFILPTHNAGELLFRTLYSYNVLTDTTAELASDTISTVTMTSGDSVVLRTDPPSASEAAWERLTLTDIRSVVIDRSTYGIWGFYDNDTLVIKGTPSATTTDTLYGSIISLGSVVSPPDGFVANDTTWLVDGSRLSYYTNDSAFAFSYPTYNATGAVTQVERSNDTFYAIGAFSSAYGSNKYVFHLAGGLNQRGIPFEIMRFADNGSADTLFLRGDSSRYAALTERTAHSSGCRYVVTRPDSTMPLQFLRYVNGTLTQHGNYGGVRHWTFDPIDTTWMSSVRDFDCKLVRWQGLGVKNAQGYAKIIKDGTAWKIHLWAVGASAYSTNQVVTIALFQNKPLSMANVGKANEYTMVEYHRGRAWYAGSVKDPTKISYSYEFDYDSIYSSGTVVTTDDNPVTGLRSMGDQMVIYLRYGMITVTGVAPSEFYYSPVSTNVGAVSNHSIARDPLTNTDYFCNEDGLWKFDGSGVSQVEVNATGLFRDSVYWNNERFFSAAVWDGKYWLSCTFGVAAGDNVLSANRLIAFDLATGDVSFINGIESNFVYRWTYPKLKDRLFVGDRDSSVLWEVNAEPWISGGVVTGDDDVRRTSIWRSGWDAFGSTADQKRINTYRLDYEVTSDSRYLTDADDDSVIVKFLGTNTSGELSETILWADTIVFTGAGITNPAKSHYATVGRAVQGRALAVQIESSDKRMRVTGFAADVVPMGKVRRQ